jgi:hypothetical protein
MTGHLSLINKKKVEELQGNRIPDDDLSVGVLGEVALRTPGYEDR